MFRARSFYLRVLLALGLMGAAPPARAELIWTTGTANEILETARTRNLPVLLVFHADWCGFCLRLDRDTLASPLVQKTGNDFIAGRIDVDLPDGSAAAKRWGITGLPAIIILSPNGQVAANVVGFKTDQELALLLRDALSGAIPLEERAARANRPGASAAEQIEAARALLDAGRIDEARALIEQSLVLLPVRSAETARARILLATTASRGSEPDAALAELARAAEATDDPAAITEAFTLRISLLRSLDGPDRPDHKAELVRVWQAYASRLASDSIVQDDCVRGLDELGVAPEVVLAQADRALALNPDSPEASGARARALYRMGKDNEALVAINRAIHLAPKEPSWRVLRLQILDRLQSAAPARS